MGKVNNLLFASRRVRRSEVAVPDRTRGRRGSLADPEPERTDDTGSAGICDCRPLAGLSAIRIREYVHVPPILVQLPFPSLPFRAFSVFATSLLTLSQPVAVAVRSAHCRWIQRPIARKLAARVAEMQLPWEFSFHDSTASRSLDSVTHSK